MNEMMNGFSQLLFYSVFRSVIKTVCWLRVFWKSFDRWLFLLFADVFRGCYKGEYGVDQNKFGCHHQGGYGGSLYCFCYGELCNNGPVPYGGH